MSEDPTPEAAPVYVPLPEGLEQVAPGPELCALLAGVDHSTLKRLPAGGAGRGAASPGRVAKRAAAGTDLGELACARAGACCGPGPVVATMAPVINADDFATTTT